jgi:ankyrin repeat protein
METIFELIDSGDADAVRALLARDPSAREARNAQSLSPLVHAAYRGRGPVFEALLAAGEPADPWDRLVAGRADGLPAPDAWSSDGFTPLHLAALVDNRDAAQALLDAGADQDVISRASFARVTPLGTCAFANAPGVARVLLEHGADPSISENGAPEGMPLAIAESNGFEKVAAVLREAG